MLIPSTVRRRRLPTGRLAYRGLLVSAIFGVSAATALGASFKTGLYSGKTKQIQYDRNGDARGRGTIHFRVRKHAVTAIRFRVDLGCIGPGAGGTDTTRRVYMKGRAHIDSRGRFHLSNPTPRRTGTFSVAGEVHGARAAGTLRGFESEDGFHHESPRNVTVCVSGRVHWTAKAGG